MLEVISFSLYSENYIDDSHGMTNKGNTVAMIVPVPEVLFKPQEDMG